MIPEPSDRTVKIPIQWIDGQWQLVGGGKLPELVSNACADLVMPAIFLADEDQRARWSEEITVPFLPKGTVLFARVNLNKIPPKLQDKVESKKSVSASGVPSRFVKIGLDEDLSLTLTPGKKGKLSECNCTIPVLSETARSVNEAYKKIVTAFEPERRSNVGNVFLLVWLDQGDRFISLDILRGQIARAAATNAARPQERTETWDELAIKMSQLYEIWTAQSLDATSERNHHMSFKTHAQFRFPETDGNALAKPGSEFFDYRQKLMLRNQEGLTSLSNRFNDPEERSPEILKLRELHAAMDRAVLAAYGWHDLAQHATCEFLLDYEEEEDDDEEDDDEEDEDEEDGSAGASLSRRQTKRQWRYRWSETFSDEVLARLLEFNKQRVELERLSGVAAITAKKKPKKTRAKKQGPELF